MTISFKKEQFSGNYELKNSRRIKCFGFKTIQMKLTL